MKTSSLTEQRWEQREKRTERWSSLVVAVVSMAIFLNTVDVSIVNVALPVLQRDLQLSTTELQWIPGIYGLTFAGCMLLGGRAADLLGRRRVFLVGATLFGLASLVSGLTTIGWVLILARGVQGIGAALTMPAATSILTTTFPEGEARNQALGIFSAIGGAGFTCGLVLGGVLTTFITWHWIFLVNVPVVLFILLLTRLVVPEGRSSLEDARSYDIAGALTVTGGLMLLVYATTQANESGATRLKTAGLLCLALVCLASFLVIEWRSHAPLMPLHIWRSHSLSAACVVSFALLGSFFGFLFMCALYLQEVLHYSPLQASLALLPGSIASIVTSQFVAPWLMNRLGMKRTVSLGMFCLLSGIILFLRAGATSDYVGIILPSTLLTQGLGMAICIPSLAIAAVAGIEPTAETAKQSNPIIKSKENTMNHPHIVSRDEQLTREKVATRARDQLNAQRRTLPMVKIDKEYLFDGRRQLIVYHFMFDPSCDEGCLRCSFLVDNIGHLAHLHAPLTKSEPFKTRMNWTIPWFSSYGSDFNADFHVTTDDGEVSGVSVHIPRTEGRY